jgi:butyryl-CoA dehydrogenase
MIPNQEQLMIRDMARDFAARELAPKAAEWERTAEPPLDVYRQMGELGLMGVCVPEEWGGGGADYVSYALALEETAAGCGAVSSVMSVNNSPVAAAILASGSDEQKERFLRPLAQGETIAAFCLTEPTTGSNASAIQTKARKVGNHYVLNGTKQFITSGSIADIAMIIAVTD